MLKKLLVDKLDKATEILKKAEYLLQQWGVPSQVVSDLQFVLHYGNLRLMIGENPWEGVSLERKIRAAAMVPELIDSVHARVMVLLKLDLDKAAEIFKTHQ